MLALPRLATLLRPVLRPLCLTESRFLTLSQATL